MAWNPFIFRNWEGPVVYQEVDTIAGETHSSHVIHTHLLLQVPVNYFRDFVTY